MNAWNAFKLDGRRSIGFIDTNLGIDHVLACRDAADCFLYIDGSGGYPAIKDTITGYGFEGIHKVDDIGGVLDRDMVVALDCFYGELADRRRAANKLTYGPSKLWADIENKRVFGWNQLKSLGVGVPDGIVVHGMLELLQFIRQAQSKKSLFIIDGKWSAKSYRMLQKAQEEKLKVFFIKISKHRGNRETSSVTNEVQAMSTLSQAGFGPFLDFLEILVQYECPGIEIGFDAFFNGKKFLRPFLFTIEKKGGGTIGVWLESNGCEQIFQKIERSLADSGYCGTFSMEFFYDGKRIYVHDPTSRVAYPCSAIQAKRIKNYDEVLFKVAAGEDCRIEISERYTTQITISSDDDKSWEAIHFPEEYRDRIGFRRVCIIGDDYFFVPGDQVAATAIGWGDTAQESLAEAVKVASVIEIPKTSYPADFVTGTLKKIDELNALGGDFRF